jgi:hypothetical protein
MRKPPALALVALLLNAVMPWSALAQVGDYSGSASGTAADVRLPGPGGSAPVHIVIGESTGAVNSQAGIIPDVATTEGDESQDFAVGTATPVRAEVGGQRHVPGSVQSSAPDNAGGSFDAVGPDPDSAFSTGHAETSSAAAPDASTASTDNATQFTGGQVIFHLPLRIPTGSSEATVERAADGEVTAIGRAELEGSSGQRVSAFGGYLTAAAIEAMSSSSADGVNSANTLDFSIQDLRLGIPGGPTYITANAGPGPGDTLLLTVTLTVPGSPPVTDTITIPRGSNLLAAATYGSPTLAPAFSALTPHLSPLTAGGPLNALQIILAAGYSDDGDGTYARGLIEAVGTSIVVGSATVAHTLGRAYSAADAQRAFSTATDPALAPGTPPTSDAAAAFGETRTASPTDIAFASDARPGTPGADPAPPEPTAPIDLPASDSPADEPVPEESAGRDRPAEEPVALATSAQEDAALPFTGLDVTAIAGLGLSLMALGALILWATRRPAAPLTALPRSFPG